MKTRFSFRRVLPLPVFISAVVSGVVLSLGFHPVNFGSISFIALVPLVVAIYGRPRAKKTYFLAGYVFGLSFFLPHFWWMLHLLPASSITLPWLMGAGLIVRFTGRPE